MALIVCGVVALALLSPASGDTKPAGGRDLCLVCHGEIGEELDGAVQHGPVSADRCTECHNPHASRHDKLLRDQGAQFCLGCHEPLANEIALANSHGALRNERACLTCHAPHASDHGGLLVQPVEQLCVTCHESVAAKLDGALPHAPAALGECTVCHSPHGSVETALLKQRVPDTCWDCHDATPELSEKHSGFTIDEADCRSCHDPHGADASPLLRAELHPPFAEGGCEFCHTTAEDPLALSERQPELCIACHDGYVAGPGSGQNHGVGDQIRCTSCHSPHAGETPGMLRGAGRQVCLGCHDAMRRRIDEATSIHPRTVEEGRCTACHKPHEAAANPLLRQEVAKVCVRCHEDHSRFAHPMGPNVKDPSRPGDTVSCVSCHDPHASPEDRLLRADPSRDLCVRCHTGPDVRAG